MGNNIHQNLRAPLNTDLFKAYSVSYDKAKRWQQLRFIITYMISIVFPLIALSHTNYRNIISIIGGIWTLTAFFITLKEKSQIKEAAKLQDEFDTNIFGLPDNNILIGTRFSKWSVQDLASDYKGKSDIENWYGNVASLPSKLDIVICQRSNVIWDWRLRKRYFWSLLSALAMLFVLGIITAIGFHLTVSQYIVIVFFPASSAFVLGIKELLEHFDNYTSRQKLEHKLNNIIEKYKKEGIDITDVTIRQIQDTIYLSRKCTALVPTWYYNLNKDSYNKRMQTVIDAV